MLSSVFRIAGVVVLAVLAVVSVVATVLGAWQWIFAAVVLVPLAALGLTI